MYYLLSSKLRKEGSDITESNLIQYDHNNELYNVTVKYLETISTNFPILFIKRVYIYLQEQDSVSVV